MGDLESPRLDRVVILREARAVQSDRKPTFVASIPFAPTPPSLRGPIPDPRFRDRSGPVPQPANGDMFQVGLGTAAEVFGRSSWPTNDSTPGVATILIGYAQAKIEKYGKIPTWRTLGSLTSVEKMGTALRRNRRNLPPFQSRLIQGAVESAPRFPPFPFAIAGRFPSDHRVGGSRVWWACLDRRRRLREEVANDS